MSPKQGTIHDCDLHANREESAQGNTCVTCGAFPTTYQWSDYSGEGMCTKCGTPYQLKWGTEEQQEEGDYPYLRLKPEWVPILREYYEETGRFTYLGWSLGRAPGQGEFFAWVEREHPEMMGADS